MHIRIFIHLHIDILQGFYPFTHKKAIFSTIILKDRNPLFIKLLVSDPLEIFWVSWSLSAVIFLHYQKLFPCIVEMEFVCSVFFLLALARNNRLPNGLNLQDTVNICIMIVREQFSLYETLFLEREFEWHERNEVI